MAVRSLEALGFDPAPGDLALTGDAARTISAVVDAMSEVEGILAGDRDGQWVGKAAEAFRASVADELTPRVQQALSSFTEAASALRQWVGQLESFQGRAQRLEERAREARDDLRAAQASLDAVPHPQDVPADQAAGAQRDRGSAQSRVDSANGALAGILHEATSLRDEVETAAGDTARRLASSASAPDEPGILDRIGNALSDIGSFLSDAWSAISDILGEIVAFLDAALPYIIFALAVASLFVPGLGPILFGLAITAIAIDTGQALSGEGSWGDVALGVAGLAAGGALGKIAGRFMAMRGNAFQIRLNSPGLALPGGGVVPGTATAAIRFRPDMYNVGSMGLASTKFTDLYRQTPAPLKPQAPDERERPR